MFNNFLTLCHQALSVAHYESVKSLEDIISEMMPHLIKEGLL